MIVYIWLVTSNTTENKQLKNWLHLKYYNGFDKVIFFKLSEIARKFLIIEEQELFVRL